MKFISIIICFLLILSPSDAFARGGGGGRGSVGGIGGRGSIGGRTGGLNRGLSALRSKNSRFDSGNQSRKSSKEWEILKEIEERKLAILSRRERLLESSRKIDQESLLASLRLKRAINI